jgi:hypothetical protein
MVQVFEGGMHFFQTVRPPYVMAECNDGMMTKATGKPASAFLLKVCSQGQEHDITSSAALKC